MHVGGRNQTARQYLGFSLLGDICALHRILSHQSPFHNLPQKLHYLQNILRFLVLERVASYVIKEWAREFSC